MTREDALTKLWALFGRAGRYQVGRRASSPERRAAAAAAVERLTREMEPLLAPLNALQKKRRQFQEEARYYKFQVSKKEGPFSIGQAKGDSWEEVFAGLETKQARAGTTARMSCRIESDN